MSSATELEWKIITVGADQIGIISDVSQAR